MERVFTAITSQPEMERKLCLNFHNKKHTKIQAQTAGAGLTDSPDDVYRTCLTAVLSLISKPSASATGTHEYPFRTVKWLPVNSKSSSYSKHINVRKQILLLQPVPFPSMNLTGNRTLGLAIVRTIFYQLSYMNTIKTLKVFCKKRWACSTWSQCLSESVDRGVALANSRFAKCQSRICRSLEDR